jgi:hypothetical protein
MGDGRSFQYSFQVNRGSEVVDVTVGDHDRRNVSWTHAKIGQNRLIFGPAPGIPVSTSTALLPLSRYAFDMPRATTDIGVTVVRVMGLTVRMPWVVIRG